MKHLLVVQYKLHVQGLDLMVRVAYMYIAKSISLLLYVGIVQRRCLGDDEWEEFFGCFREETKILLNQVTSYPSAKLYV